MFVPGQRWLNSQQPELGLGLVTDVQARQVHVFFPLVNSDAIYAKDSAPLIRFALSTGESAQDHQGRDLIVEGSEEEQGIITYQVSYADGTSAPLFETQLAHHLQINQPHKRLFSGQLDRPQWFDVRKTAYAAQYALNTDPAMGILGARITPLEHQINIVQQVGTRYQPRVLLADEVGLGKTLEAAMILQKQRLLGRCQRALIIVPEALQHQWLVEMHRRINMLFSLFDAERLETLRENEEDIWHSAQWVITSVEALDAHPQNKASLLDAQWDCLIVDEAHHYTDAQDEHYSLLTALSAQIPSVLLLTATPDQLGSNAHFAQLQLLDPNRFVDAAVFAEEQSQYQQLAALSEQLLVAEMPLSQTLLNDCAALLPELSSTDIASHSPQQLIQELIDRHGTGRLFYRNTRAAIGHQNQRQLLPHPLAAPASYKSNKTSLQAHVHEDTQWVKTWLTDDPKVAWLVEYLNGAQGKTLLICRTARTVLQLAEHLRVSTGKNIPVFHEQMTIAERDRAAHFFADPEAGAPLLLCSEIGSEGRNFQFCQDLILFDLPLNPDLLEQRIGRLDRIGQTQTIRIHVPYHQNSAQAQLFALYHEGLNAFAQTCTVGSDVFAAFGQRPLDIALSDCFEQDLQTVQALANQHNEANQSGRNKLLEINAKGFEQHEALLARLDEEQPGADAYAFLQTVADMVGIKMSVHDNHSYVLHASEELAYPLRHLPEDGMTVTFSRRVATANEHYDYMTFEHPLLRELMDVLLSDNNGRASVGMLADPALPVGAFFVECAFVIQAASSAEHNPYLTPQSFVLSCDHTAEVTEIEKSSLRPSKKVVAAKLLNALEAPITQVLAKASEMANAQAQTIKQAALNDLQHSLGEEVARLRYLQQINPSVRDTEIQALQGQLAQAQREIDNAPINLDAVRVLVNNP
jgi:ATP-dependent helicase HepA